MSPTLALQDNLLYTLTAQCPQSRWKHDGGRLQQVGERARRGHVSLLRPRHAATANDTAAPHTPRARAGGGIAHAAAGAGADVPRQTQLGGVMVIILGRCDMTKHMMMAWASLVRHARAWRAKSNGGQPRRG
jgi:hypothetical protein